MDRRSFLELVPALVLSNAETVRGARRTQISTVDDRFFINGTPTYEGRTYRGMSIEGLLMNSRMVQGIFDDLNPNTRSRWRYPDTNQWDPERNTREFIAAMPEWRRHGLLSFTINFQGGSPEGYSNEQPWYNSAFRSDGTMYPKYLKRMEQILDKADQLGMVPILGIYYFGQDQRLQGEVAIIRGVREVLQWLFQKDYRNLLIEINNECNVRKYDHDILKPARVHELIHLAKSIIRNSRRFLVGTSWGGGAIPTANVVTASDFLLLHGNGIEDPRRISDMVRQTRKVPGYRPMPILFNEDDHFDFDKRLNNMLQAISEYASWGFFDPGKNDYNEGYQSPPINWSINTKRKQAFFALVKEVTGS